MPVRTLRKVSSSPKYRCFDKKKRREKKEGEGGCKPQGDVGNHLESRLHSVIFHLAGLDGSHVAARVIAEDVECILTRQCHELAALAPVDLLRVHLDPPDQAARRPVVEGDTPLALDPQEHAAAQAVGRECDVEAPGLLDKVLEDLDACCGFADGKVVAVVPGTPYKVEGRPESLVSPSVRHEFVVSGSAWPPTPGAGVSTPQGATYARAV